MTQVKAGKPPRKPSSKGTPPTIAGAKPVPAVTNFADRKSEGEQVAMNLRKSAAWRKKVMQFCLDHDMTWTDLAETAVEEYMAARKS